MATDIVLHPAPAAQQTPTDLTCILQDGVHPYDDPEDKWVVIVDGEEVAWATTQSQAWRSYHELLRIEDDRII